VGLQKMCDFRGLPWGGQAKALQLLWGVRRRVFVSFILGVVFGVLQAPRPMPVSASRLPSSESGYVADVRMEKQQKFYEVYLLPPQREMKLDYRGLIFNSQLTQEFKLRWREKFGHIDADGVAFAANRFTQFEENRGRSAKLAETTLKRRAFGEYMMRRLGEYHVDNYFKSQPSMREVYELKERLSNVQVQVGPSFKMDVHYSFSDNSAELTVANPYCDSKLRIEMDPAAFGPSSIKENRLFIGVRLNSVHYLLGTVMQNDGLAKMEWRNNYAFGIATSLSVMTPFKGGGTSPRESSMGAAVLHAF
jgi:hypothetical protein